MEKKVAILLSGHMRNIEEIIDNFKYNFIKPISDKFEYDIYIHTWDNNLTNDNIMNNDKLFLNIKIDNEYIYKLFHQNDIIIKKIIIENQEEIYNNLNIQEYLNTNTCGKSIHNNLSSNYVKDLTNKLFFQYYGHYKLLNCLDKDDKYDFIIKTRPDLFYDVFDINLFNYDIFFPSSHGGININQLFFGGKTEYIINILNFFEKIIFHNQQINFELVEKYHKTDINFNYLFRYYIIKILKYNPFYTNYNPKIYRNKNKIITLI
jgi:hypothetical protein